MIPHGKRMIDHTRLYLEHCRIFVDDGRLVFASNKEGTINALPYKNTPFLLLGSGTSITQEAARLLAGERVPFGFCGADETPLFTSVDVVWQLSCDEYGPMEYMQHWARLWFDERSRLRAAKHFFHRRLEMSRMVWDNEIYVTPDEIIDENLADEIEACQTVNDLLSLEAQLTKRTYAVFARTKDIKSFSRQRGLEHANSEADRINCLLDSGNYLAYGLAASALAALGIPHGFPVMRGKTRRSGLVLDVADLIKSAIVLPEAFVLGKAGADFLEAKESICHLAKEYDAIGFMIDTIEQCISATSASIITT